MSTTASSKSPGEINGGEMTGVSHTNIPTDTFVAKIVCSNRYVSLTYIIYTSDRLQPTYRHDHTHTDEAARTHSLLLVVVMEF